MNNRVESVSYSIVLIAWSWSLSANQGDRWQMDTSPKLAYIQLYTYWVVYASRGKNAMDGYRRHESTCWCQ